MRGVAPDACQPGDHLLSTTLFLTAGGAGLSDVSARGSLASMGAGANWSGSGTGSEQVQGKVRMLGTRDGRNGTSERLNHLKRLIQKKN